MKDLRFIGKCLLVVEEGKKILVIGDLHVGYEEAMNNTGVFVSRKMYEEMIEELERVFDSAGKVDRIVLLGDVKHGFARGTSQEWDELIKLFKFLKEECNDIVILQGNHDNYLMNIANRVSVGVKDYLIVGETALIHGDSDKVEIYDTRVKRWIMGHGHPAVRLNDGIKSESYKCFLVGKFKGKEVVIVPSFFDLQTGTDPREFELGMAWPFDLNKFEVYVVSEDLKVLEFGKLEKIK
ncbi:MAG: metallophosphoesterase [archaeon]